MNESIQIRLLNTLTGTLWQKIELAAPAQRDAAIDACMASARELLARGARDPAGHFWFTHTARQNLASLAFKKREFAECAAQARQLLDESKDRLGECHSIRISAMCTLADALNRLGQVQEPADVYLHLIGCMRAGSSGDSLRLLATLTDALPFFDRASRWPEGEACAREVLEILKSMGDSHIGTFLYETYIAHFASEQGRLDEADGLFQSLDGRKSEADDDAERIRHDLWYAGHLTRRGDFKQAEGRLKNVMEVIHDVRDGTTAWYPDDILVEAIALYTAWGMPEEAQKYQTMSRGHQE